jgi:histone acetyltransferase MYST1
MISHFDMSDQQWKNSERMSAGDLLSDQSDRKITRNQKRRHDEINHIQKVNIYQFLSVINVVMRLKKEELYTSTPHLCLHDMVQWELYLFYHL